MPSVRSICQQAMRKIGASDLIADGDAIDEALDAYNNMLHGWKLMGVDIEHDTQALSDAFPLGDEFAEGTIYILAQRLQPNYEIPAMFNIEDWWRAFQAAYATIDDVSFEVGLTQPPSYNSWRWL